MGYTKFTTDLIERNLSAANSILDFGSCNLYITAEEKPPFVDTWFAQKGITDYTAIDLAGDNNALKMDCSYPIELERRFGLIIDAGFSEHVVRMKEYKTVAFHDGHINSIYPVGEPENIELGYYYCWKNKFELCEIGGLVISENPLTGHWPQHGYSYLGPDFYKELCKIADLELIEDGMEGAMGNTTSGMNVYGVVKKTGDKFPSLEDFNKLPIFKS